MTDEEVLAAYRMGLLVPRVPRKKYKRSIWNDQRINHAVALVAEKGAKRAAAELGVAYATLTKALRSVGASIRERKRGEMPERMRQVVELRLDGKTYNQIAELLGIQPGNVSTQIVRARRRGIDV